MMYNSRPGYCVSVCTVKPVLYCTVAQKDIKETLGNNLGAAQHNLGAAQHNLGAAQHNLGAAQHNFIFRRSRA